MSQSAHARTLVSNSQSEPARFQKKINHLSQTRVASPARMLPFQELHTTCKGELTTQNTVKRLISTWLNYSECMEDACTTTNLNDMHLFGLGLCHVLNTLDPLECHGYSAATELGEHCSLLTNDIDIHTCTWGQMTQLVYSLQNTYADLLTYDAYTGYDCKVDVTHFILVLMSRIGELLSKLYLWSSLSSEEQVALSPYYEHESDGYYILKPTACVEVIDILHSVFRLVTLLMAAKPVGPASAENVPNLNKFHHEASLDDFYKISTVMDCPPGSILWYKHNFKDLFHDASQVVYHRFPTYCRNVQIPLADIQSGKCSAVNVLPLLMQIFPNVPIVMEQTGAYTNSTFTGARWSWLVWHRHILLCSEDGNVYCAQNIFDLCAHMSTSTEKTQESIGEVRPEQRVVRRRILRNAN